MKKHKGLSILKILLVIFLAMTALVVINALLKLRFGYIIKKFDTPYRHCLLQNNASLQGCIIQASNGDIIIMGEYDYISFGEDIITGEEKPDKEIYDVPFLIYKAEAKSLKEFRLPNNIMYFPQGIAIENNKFILTNVHFASRKPTNINIEGYLPPYQYDYIAIIDLNALNNIKLIKKKINKLYLESEHEFFNVSFTILDNGKLFMLDPFNKIAEIFDIEKGASEIINGTELPKSKENIIFPYEENKVLIFIKTPIDENEHVYIYDDIKKNIMPYAKIGCAHSAIQVNDEEFYYFCGNTVNRFNAKTKQIINMGKIKYNRTTNRIGGSIIKNRYILIGGGYFQTYSEEPFYTHLIFDTHAGKTYKYFNSRYNGLNPIFLKLNNENILIYDKELKIFKQKEN